VETHALSRGDLALQNIPVRTALGAQIRRAFFSAPLFPTVDFSDLEHRTHAVACRGWRCDVCRILRRGFRPLRARTALPLVPGVADAFLTGGVS
jgi:hypothetical protein